ncbi:MAG TPA: ester cyclase [Vicinamibacterales bacterium]|nr:ester cyclase [Vicinamibacterales bacterium]
MADNSNRDLGRRFFEAQDRLRGGPDPALCAPGYQAVIGGNPPMNRDGHEQFALGFYAAFPDANHHVSHVFDDGGNVAVRFTIKGTHTGNFFGIPATGRAVSVTANVLLETKDGKVTRLFGIFDEAGLLRQIGVLGG